MALKTVGKGSNNKTATLSPAGSVTLSATDTALTLAINATDFTDNETINKVEFWNDVSGNKGTSLQGTWYSVDDAEHPSSIPAGVSIAGDSTGRGVVITDINENDDNSNDQYYYKVFTSDGRSADPELILQKRSLG